MGHNYPISNRLTTSMTIFLKESGTHLNNVFADIDQINQLKMDAAFEIFLPGEVDLKKLGFGVDSFFWEGLPYEETLKYKFGANFELNVIGKYDFQVLEREAPKVFHERSWIPINVGGSGMDIFINSLYSLEPEEVNFSLRSLLNTVLGHQKRWAILYSPQYDGFDDIRKGSIENTIELFSDRVTQGGPGFLIYK